MSNLAWLALATLSITACSTASPDDFVDRAARMEGIYRVDSHVQNFAACTPDGDEVADDDGFAFAKLGTIFGTDFLAVYSCKSLDECRQRAAADTFEGAIAFGFTLTAADARDPDALTGIETTTGFGDGSGVCVAPEQSDLTLARTGTALHFARAIHVGADYSTPDGVCTTDAGGASAAQAPCSEMETLALSLVEPLP